MACAYNLRVKEVVTGGSLGLAGPHPQIPSSMRDSASKYKEEWLRKTFSMGCLQARGLLHKHVLTDCHGPCLPSLFSLRLSLFSPPLLHITRVIVWEVKALSSEEHKKALSKLEDRWGTVHIYKTFFWEFGSECKVYKISQSGFSYLSLFMFLDRN